MPALSTDVARATRAVIVNIQSSGPVLARQPGARDGTLSPRTGYFDSAADAAVVNAAAFALIGTERRRFSVRVADVIEPVATMDATLVTPTVTLVDASLAVDGPCLIARLQIDDEAGTTSMEVFG